MKGELAMAVELDGSTLPPAAALREHCAGEGTPATMGATGKLRSGAAIHYFACRGIG